MKTKMTLLIILFPILLYGNDTLTLTNQAIFEGKVTKIKDCIVTFKHEGEKYHIPATDIYSIKFGNPQDKIYTDYLEFISNYQEGNCLKGQLDADNYHGKVGMHVALGVLFGPFAVIGAAVASPTPEKSTKTLMMSQNKDLFNNAEYLSCYKRKAKGQNVVNTTLGWAAWIVLLLVI